MENFPPILFMYFHPQNSAGHIPQNSEKLDKHVIHHLFPSLYKSTCDQTGSEVINLLAAKLRSQQ